MSNIITRPKKLIVPAHTAPKTEIAVPTGDTRALNFEANGQKHTGEVDLSKYSTKVVRAHIRTIKASEKLEDEDEQEDALFDAGISFAVIGGTSPSFPEISVDALGEANFSLTVAFTKAVQEAVFQSSSDSAV